MHAKHLPHSVIYKDFHSHWEARSMRECTIKDLSTRESLREFLFALPNNAPACC